MGTGAARGFVGTALALALLALPVPARAEAPSSCPGDGIDPDRVITGEFDDELEGAYVLVGFRVPKGTTAVRVKYCHDQPDAPTNARLRHTLDLGLYEPIPRARRIPGEDEFRGWSGSGAHDVTVSRQGFADDPQEREPGRTSHSYVPGAIPPGRWYAELGLASIVPQSQGDQDGKVAWRVEIELSDDRDFARHRYDPARYDSDPADSGPGWYAGDFHVHAEHSGDARQTRMEEAFEFAFAPLADGGAGLDFISLTEHNTGSHWKEIGRLQEDHPDKLVIRGEEVTTYRGHLNSHGAVRWVDYRTGPILKRRHDDRLKLLREGSGPEEVFDAIHRAGGLTQINHPTIFPSEVPGFDAICRGCSWDFDDGETGYRDVDAIEISTGPAGLQAPPSPGPNPFTPPAIQFWEDRLADGYRIAAVGASDSHNAGETPDAVTQSPIGTATTVVRADELSERGIRRGVQAGHTYVKLFGNHGPDLRFEARRTGGGGGTAIMGDTLRSAEADFLARVIGGGPSTDPDRPGTFTLHVFKDGLPLLSAPVTGDDFLFPFPSAGVGRYRLQVQRGSAIEAVSSPIYLEPDGD